MGSAGTTAVVTFNDQGVVVKIVGSTQDGMSATLTVENSTTTLDGDLLTFTFPTPAGQGSFEGTLSNDQNTITGSLTREIDFEDGMITIPEGDITLDRIVVDPCEDVTCGDGETCVDGECVATDLCDGVTCGDGETCVNGECVATDPCDGVTCGDGETCIDGECVADDPCAGVTCGTCEECVDGQCIDLAFNQAAGEAFYAANGCANCHGASANDGSAPSLVGANCGLLYDKMSGTVSHDGGTVDGLTEQDAADLEAWLASLE